MRSLKQRPDLPARVRTLLEGMLERAANQFEHALSRTLDEVEQEIFKLAERARSNEQQHARFEALRAASAGEVSAVPVLRALRTTTQDPAERAELEAWLRVLAP